MRYRFLALGFVGMAAATWLACSGDDKTDATTIGAEGQACLPGDQCIAGFICVGGKCITSNIGAGEGGVLKVGNPKATSDDCEDIGQAEQALCPTPDAGDALCTDEQQFCCPGQGCQTGNDACNAPEGHFECFATSQCQATSNGHCCLEVVPSQGGACQATTINPKAGSTCTGGADTACDPDFDIELCQSDNDCPANGPCTKTVITFAGVDGTPYTKTIGYCATPPVDSGAPPPAPDAGGTTDAGKGDGGN